MAALNPGIVSTGTINSVIDTYKPKDFFTAGGIITIVHMGVVVATIHVSLNNADNDNQKQSLVSNNGRYIIDGDDVSLRRLNRLCNLDITNKADYLRFNGSPAVVPKDFAVEESSKSFSVTPARDQRVFTLARQNFRTFHDISEMLAALDETDDVPGLSYSEPDLKTVYVLVSMHGEDKKNMIKNTIINKVYILPSGLCSTPLETQSEQLIRLKQFWRTPTVLIEKTYEMESHSRIAALKKNVEISLTTGEHAETLVRGLSQAQIPKRIAQYGELEKLHVGPLLQDREYTHDSGALVFSEFISIIGSNWKEEEMMRSYGKFSADKTLSRQINTHFSRFNKPIVIQETAADEFQQIQSVNLLNIEVLEKITTTMNGRNIPFERFKGMIAETDRLTTTTAGTGIPHYTNVRLTHLLSLFEKLGFQKVVLFDEGCRTGNMYDTSGRAADESLAAEESGGGRTKRRRTRRRRSRRSHKKS